MSQAFTLLLLLPAARIVHKDIKVQIIAENVSQPSNRQSSIAPKSLSPGNSGIIGTVGTGTENRLADGEGRERKEMKTKQSKQMRKWLFGLSNVKLQILWPSFTSWPTHTIFMNPYILCLLAYTCGSLLFFSQQRTVKFTFSGSFPFFPNPINIYIYTASFFFFKANVKAFMSWQTQQKKKNSP